MQPEQHVFFSPFHLDLANEQVWREGQPMPLRPKLFAILRYLVEHPGRLVSREELLKAVWPGTVVSESVLRGCIRALREALEDDAEAPRFIETVARRGYRFLAPLTTTPPVVSSQSPVASKKQAEDSPPQLTTDTWQLATRSPQLTTDNWQLTTPLVGREAELTHLQAVLHKALSGQRQMVFVTGEPGIGKTTVVEAFLRRLETGDWSLAPSPQASSLQPLASHVCIGRGQCVEQYGAGEAYLPVLEALGRLCRETGGERLVALLRQHAPTWLMQMPAVLSEAELEAVQRKVQGATRERMLREFAEAIEVLATETLLVLLLEDLHWSDYATLDLLSLLARRREAARLLVLGTYRPADVVMSGHPLKAAKQELQTHGHCEELALTFLTDAAVAQYLDVRFPRHQFPFSLAQFIYQNTDGNPLFMVNTVDYLVQQGIVSEQDGQWQLQVPPHEVTVGAPENVWQLIEKQIERLSEEQQQLLEVASVAGVEFSAAVLTAGGIDASKSEEKCEELVRRGQFLQTRGVAEWPDGVVATRYGFLHALYQNVLYARIPAGRRMRLHQQIGALLETSYGTQARDIAAELATHFERGREGQRTVKYLGLAAENLLRRHAYHQAVALLTRALEFLRPLPESHERDQQELALQISLGVAFMSTKGYAAAEVEQVYARARELCRQVEETPGLLSVLLGLWVFYLVRAELQTARELGEQCLTLARNVQDPAFLMEAHHALGGTLFHLGELASARAHLEQGIALYESLQHSPHVSAQDFRVVCLSYLARVLWLLGYPDQALKTADKACILAQELAHPFSLAFARFSIAALHQFRGERHATQEWAEDLLALCREQGFPYFLAMGTVVWGWALTAQGQGEEGLAQMQQGLSAYQATGAELSLPHFYALVAEAYEKVGQAEEGLSALAEGLTAVGKGGKRFSEAELYRLKGELMLKQSGVRSSGFGVKKRSKFEVQHSTPKINIPQSVIHNPQSDAEACFHKAIDIARQQQAKSLELRAVMSLARLWHQQGRTEEARRRLAEIYEWFTEGWDTADLLEAQNLLRDLSSGGSPHVP